MALKGISLPVNAVVIIALAVMVLLLIAAFFGSGVGQIGAANIESAWTQGCNALKSANCNASAVKNITVGDVTGDDKPDNLLTVCRIKFKKDDASIYWCRNQCCHTVISEGTECEEYHHEDCRFGLFRDDWHCDNGHCCPKGKNWNADTQSCTS